VSVYDHTLICPDPLIFCDKMKKYCENDCNSKGVCLLDKSC